MNAKPNLFERITGRLLGPEIEKQVRARLGAVWVENDETFALASRSWNFTLRDRYDADRETILQESLDAWRLNPLARRIVGLTTQYVVGGGISVGAKHGPTHKFITDFWNHRLNRMGVRCYELCDELTRTGNLMLLLSSDASGMSFVRPVPASDIAAITARPNDIEQPLCFIPKAGVNDLDPAPYPAYAEESDAPGPDGCFPPVMLHYTINRPVGAQWGESDLAPVLKWLSRYSNWLEDRARLNRFRNSFVFVVKAAFTSEAERAARQAQLALNPPRPGSILVADASETWEVLSPKLESSDAAADGLGLKKMIASGSGIPLHFLAEPESSTRTTSESAGGPTYRHFEQRQNYFIWIMEDLLKIVVARRAMVDSHVSKKAQIDVRGADISARDNVALSMAGQNIINMLGDLRDRLLITDGEYLRLAYRFAGEIVDVEDMLKAAKAQGLPIKASQNPHLVQVAGADGAAGPENNRIRGTRRGGGANVLDPDTGELKDSVSNPVR